MSVVLDWPTRCWPPAWTNFRSKRTVLASPLPKQVLHPPILIQYHYSCLLQQHRGSVSEQMYPSLVFSHLPARTDLGFGNLY